jgi:hypothetical protein
VDQRGTGRHTAPWRKVVVGTARLLAVPAAAVAVFVLGQFFGELSVGRNFVGGLLAALGTVGLLYPGATFRLDAPRRWFAGPRPGPSQSYLTTSRIAGVIMLIGSVLWVLLVPESAY